MPHVSLSKKSIHALTDRQPRTIQSTQDWMDLSTSLTAHATITLHGHHTQLLEASAWLYLQKHSSSTSCVHHCGLSIIKFVCGGLSSTERSYMSIGNWPNKNRWIEIELGKQWVPAMEITMMRAVASFISVSYSGRWEVWSWSRAVVGGRSGVWHGTFSPGL
jgi:hypothetical protein